MRITLWQNQDNVQRPLLNMTAAIKQQGAQMYGSCQENETGEASRGQLLAIQEFV